MATPVGADGQDAYSQLKGIISGADEQPDESPDEQPEPEAAEADTGEQHEAEAAEASEPEAEEAPTEEAEQTEDDGEEGDTPTLQTLNDVAEALGTDADSLSGVNVTVKVDGEAQEVPLQDVLKSYQLQGHVNKKSMELSEQQKQLQQHLDSFEQQSGQRIQHLDQLAEALKGELYPQQDLDRLRTEDFESYMQAKDRQDRINQRIQEVHQQRQHHDQQAQQAHQQRMQQYLQEQQDKLPESIPEWKDPDTAKAEKAKLRTFLNSQGFTDDEVGNVVDARVVTLARKAMLYDSLQESKPAVTKKVKAKPKYQKPGSANQKRNRQQEAKKRDWERFKRSGGRDRGAAVNVFKDAIKG